MSKITVLLVDDHEGFINAALRHLRKVEWLDVVGRASNGLEAIERSETLRPDVVLMDLAMPEMGGLQATRLIKTQDAPPFIVIASHFDDAEHREHAMRAGADDDRQPVVRALAAHIHVTGAGDPAGCQVHEFEQAGQAFGTRGVGVDDEDAGFTHGGCL